MAALSCYQPCRSHLAQPARCLNDDEDPSPASFHLRRRQFIERCHEARTRPRDVNADVHSSVKRTRDELVKHAAATAAVNRRLNVESGWSKVEEVRKKFEDAAASASFSRSFESPPRRRLADSLFASFKLPRRKDTMAAPRSLAPQPQQKRKSAVELLAESKAFYVKSETVLDRKQELPLRVSSGLSQAIAAGGCHLISSGTLTNEACCNPYATTRLGGARRAVSAGEGLQNTLRRLLEHTDSRENVYNPAYAAHKIYSDPRRLKDYPDRDMSRSQHNSGTFSGTSSSGTSGSKAHKSDPEHRDKMNRPLSFGDARVFFPESFVIPRQRPEVVIKSAYSIPSSHSSPEHMELPEPVLSDGGSPGEQIGAISPPAHYAHSTPRYIRSNSHSQPSMREEEGCHNINSHKSLPDLHTQTRCYPEHMNVGGTDTVGRSPRRRRHSPHQRTASCSSKGTRSNHSSLMSSCEAFSEHPSPGEENYQSYNSRCGSSFARDSGGSSGHYTQRSAPPHAQHRTDSGSSTQHDQSRYNYYAEECYSPLEAVVVSAPPQFQDGAPSPPPHAHAHAPHAAHDAHDTHDAHAHAPRVGIHFQASAPPPQFQDEPPMYDYNDFECSYKPLKCLTVGRKERDYTSREYTRYHEPSTELVSKQPQYARPPPRLDDNQDYVNATQICPAEEVTSPLGTFKRQRCLRYKQRRPRPILRSKSDISDR
ncbi:uncharacterized protein LOC126376498 isoform X2 [Pectinophora gossypiella]|nr:uncharacterized protein LOC126376498 isoform X2 [Pectinophora gossypiella]